MTHENTFYKNNTFVMSLRNIVKIWFECISRWLFYNR